MLVYKHLSTLLCSCMVPMHHTINSNLCPNACIEASEHLSVLIHRPNKLYHKFWTSAQMLVYKHLSTFQCSLMVPTYHTVSFGLVPKCLQTSIWALSSARSWSQHIILYVSDLRPNACIQASEHFSVLIHRPEISDHMFRTCAQMLVYKHLSTCQCSFIVPIYHTIRFGLAPKCLYTSIWALFSAHSWSQYSIL